MQKHSIASVCLFRSGKVREEEVYVFGQNGGEILLTFTELFQVNIASCMAMDWSMGD